MKNCNVLEGFGGRVTVTQKDPFGTLVFGKNNRWKAGLLKNQRYVCVCVCVLGGPNYTRYPLSANVRLPAAVA